MAKRRTVKQPDSSGEEKTAKPTRNGKPLHVCLDPALRTAMDALVGKTRRSLTTEVTIALEKHLEREGLLPPSP